MSRNFNTWLSGFRDSISDYAYYVNFEKVYMSILKKSTGMLMQLRLN